MIFSSYYGNVKKILSVYSMRNLDDFRGISVRSCRDLDIKNVSLVNPVFSDVMNFKTGKISWKEYCLNYYEKLHKISDQDWKEFFQECNEKILLCYEKDVKTCHRYLLGKYLFWKFGSCKIVEIDNNLKLWKIEKNLKEV